MTNRYRDKPYSLFPRKMPSGKTVWYYQSYGADGSRTNPASTGIGFTREKDRAKTRREAVASLDRMVESGQIGDSRNVPILEQWINGRHFWNWNRSDYVRSIIVRSEKDKPGITRSYVDTAAQITRDHILPYHGNKYIDEITPYDCEQLLFQWVDEGATNKTANNWKSVYSTILGEYERDRKMRNPRSTYFNPWRMVQPLKVSKNRYGALTIAEVARIVNPEGLDYGKTRDRIYYYAVKLAFMTGLRIGEVCGLLISDIKDVEFRQGDSAIRGSYLHVTHSYDPKNQERKLVKDKEARDIPISASLRDELEQFIDGREAGRYLFSFAPDHNRPIPAARLREWLYERMEMVGINDREQRHITFHSARRFFNTLLRHERIADDVIRRFTGHDSQEMTDHYTDYLPEDLQAITLAQKKLIEGNIK